MKIIIHLVTITLFLIVLFAGACKKESTPAPPVINNHKPQTCYVSTETIKDNYGGSNKTTTVTSFYDANHTLTKATYNEDGSIQTVIYTTNGNQYRSDVYFSQTPGDPGSHSQYVILYLNTNGRADSSTQYNCVDCSIPEPTTFARAFVIKFAYSGSTLINEETHVPGEAGAHSKSKYEYDGKGRLAYHVSFDEYGDTSGYEILTYSATESNNFKPGEPQGYFNFIYGDAASYQPQSSLIYSSSVGVPSTIDWVNSGNQDGYLLSTTGTIAGSAYQTITYTYDCVDK